MSGNRALGAEDARHVWAHFLTHIGTFRLANRSSFNYPQLAQGQSIASDILVQGNLSAILGPWGSRLQYDNCTFLKFSHHVHVITLHRSPPPAPSSSSPYHAP